MTFQISSNGLAWGFAAAETLAGLYLAGGAAGLASGGAALAVRLARQLGPTLFGRAPEPKVA